jgi:hypothetical protein
MNDKVILIPWSQVAVNMDIRWSTPRFVLYGRILDIQGQSMVAFFTDRNKRVLPDAEWYYGRSPEDEEHLVVIQRGEEKQGYLRSSAFVEEWVTVQAACELIQMDAKQMRRHIRNAVIPAHKDKFERWQIHREKLMEVAVKRGWV